MRPRWKVCGITSREDAAAAVAAGADAIGLVFYPPSPRAVDFETAAEIAASLPDETWRIGVFVDAARDRMTTAIEEVGLDFLQLHGDEKPESTRDLPRHAFKALRLAADATPDEARTLADGYPDCTLLVDTASSSLYGGTGVPSNWAAAAALARRHRLMRAGGLTADNVGDAVRRVRPWAVDVSSGVESSPGRKDEGKLRAFARALEELR